MGQVASFCFPNPELDFCDVWGLEEDGAGPGAEHARKMTRAGVIFGEETVRARRCQRPGRGCAPEAVASADAPEVEKGPRLSFLPRGSSCEDFREEGASERSKFVLPQRPCT